MPTARKAISFTKDSNAIAATKPSCLSDASIERVPKRIIKTERIPAIKYVLSFQLFAPKLCPVLLMS